MMPGTLYSMAFRVIKPIPVAIYPFGQGYVAVWQAVTEFGLGPTPSDARDDLISSIKEMWGIYSTSDLGPALQRDWIVMQEHIVKRINL